MTLGIFALPELCDLLIGRTSVVKSNIPIHTLTGLWQGIRDCFTNWFLVLRCSALGSALGAIPGIILVAATNPGLLPWVALAYFMVQQLENNLLVPRIQGEALDLHPAVIILLLAIGRAVGRGN